MAHETYIRGVDCGEAFLFRERRMVGAVTRITNMLIAAGVSDNRINNEVMSGMETIPLGLVDPESSCKVDCALGFRYWIPLALSEADVVQA